MWGNGTLNTRRLSAEFGPTALPMNEHSDMLRIIGRSRFDTWNTLYLV